MIRHTSTRIARSIARRRTACWFAGILSLQAVSAASGCGSSAPRPLSVGPDNIASLQLSSPYLLPANTKLETLQKCAVSFPGADLFEPGDVVGQVVVIDNDALIGMSPNNEKITVRLERGHSMSITKPRVITVYEADETPSRFKVTPPDGG